MERWCPMNIRQISPKYKHVVQWIYRKYSKIFSIDELDSYYDYAIWKTTQKYQEGDPNFIGCLVNHMKWECSKYAKFLRSTPKTNQIQLDKDISFTNDNHLEAIEKFPIIYCIIKMRICDNYSFEDISQKIGVPRETVRQRYLQGLKILKKSLS